MAGRKCVTEAGPATRLTPAWILLPLVLAIAVLNYADRYLLAGLSMPVKREFALTDSFMGLLLGPAFALLYGLLAIPASRLADRTSRIAILASGCAIWSLFTMLTAFASAPWMLALSRVGVGVGEASYQAPVAALIASYFPVDKRGKVFGLLATAIYLGQILGYTGGPAIAAQTGSWRNAFLFIGLSGLVVAVAAFALIREPHRAPNAAKPEALLPIFKRAWKLASFRNMAFGMAFGTLSGLVFGLWGTALYERAYGITTKEAGAAFGLAMSIPGLIGTLAFGALADRLAKKGMRGPLLLSAGALLFATMMTLCVTWAPTKTMAMLFSVPCGLLGGGWSVGIIAGLQFLFPERYRATGTALAMLAVTLIANAAGPLIAGRLSDLFPGEGAHSLRMALSIVIPVGFIGALLMWRASKTLDADQAALAAQG
jgi:MFS family permease